MRNVSDEALVREVQEGSISAFEDLVRRYQAKLLRFVIRIVFDTQAAEDVVQETFINLYKSIERIDTSKRLASYLFSIARNQAISLLRMQKRELPLEEAATLTTTETPEVHMDRSDEKRRVREALHKVDQKYRDVISLYYFENLSYEEISKRLQFPLNTVRTHLKRAKEALRKKLM